MGDQQIVSQSFVLSLELFQGDAAYKPRDWEVRATLVGNLNYAHVQELGLVNPDVGEGRDRFDEEFAAQELFVEKHLGDLSSNLADSEQAVEDFLQLAPTKIDLITRTAVNGSWFNFFMCSANGTFTLPGAGTGVEVPASGRSEQPGCN